MINTDAPRDGDIAHRQGFTLTDNPWSSSHQDKFDLWRSDWLFRHNHAPMSAADAPNGRLRPSQTSRARF